ncbi:sensor histidine kinase [Streptomyces sp. NPDC058953]|uniref:sensor histidine kinase n=1 Tax=unclassified Streptomyces TaxID=2593676 RepID=UPI003673D416
MGTRESRPLVAGRLGAGHWAGVDAGAGVLLAAVFGLGEAWRAGPAAVTVTVVAWLPLTARRRHPLPALAVAVAAAGCGVAVTSWQGGWVAAGAVLYTVATRESRRRAGVAFAGSVGAAWSAAALAAGPGPMAPSDALSDAVFASVLMTLSWLVGTALREQRAHAALAGRQALVDEQLRIARDLHDVVAHQLTAITVRAEIARAVAATRPREAEETLELVGVAGREALAGMRRMLTALRSGPAGEWAAPGREPGLADLPSLVAGTGLAVELSVDPATALPPGTGPTVYRIVQEALTNVVRHAGSAGCRVVIRPGDRGSVVAEIVNGPSPRPGSAMGLGGGYGLVGMAERAAAHGGDVEAGPTADGGFRVRLLLPRGPGPESGVPRWQATAGRWTGRRGAER